MPLLPILSFFLLTPYLRGYMLLLTFLFVSVVGFCCVVSEDIFNYYL
jgi:hypothetical protein